MPRIFLLPKILLYLHMKNLLILSLTFLVLGIGNVFGIDSVEKQVNQVVFVADSSGTNSVAAEIVAVSQVVEGLKSDEVRLKDIQKSKNIKHYQKPVDKIGKTFKGHQKTIYNRVQNK